MKKIINRIKKNRVLPFMIIVVFLLFPSCATVGPNYSPPKIKVPSKWHDVKGGGKIYAGKKNDSSLEGWWKLFNDPTLNDLIDRAIKDNLDIKQAVARVTEAKANRGISESNLYPSVSSSASATRTRSSGISSKLYQLGFDASWEPDFFGGIRRAIEASNADLESTKDALRDVMLSLTAEVALNYVDLRVYQARMAVIQSNLRSQEDTYKIVSWRYQAGLVTALDLETEKYTLEQTRSQLPILRSEIDQAKNKIAVLLGCNPGSLNAELDHVSPIPVFSGKINAGIPADILRRRPDVREAERNLAAQTARIGVAVSDLYPKITLSGSINLGSPTTGGLFNSGSITRSGGPSISWPIFRAGAIMDNIRVQKSIAKQDLVQYKSAVLSALEDVENALSSCAYERETRESLKKAVDAAKKSYKLSRDQYVSGLIDFATLLETQRTLLSLQDQLTQSDGQVTLNYITLYKALGGGWTSSNTQK